MVSLGFLKVIELAKNEKLGKLRLFKVKLIFLLIVNSRKQSLIDSPVSAHGSSPGQLPQPVHQVVLARRGRLQERHQVLQLGGQLRRHQLC